jgi:hypothetical protein
VPIHRDEEDFPETGQDADGKTFASRLEAVDEAGKSYLRAMERAERAFHFLLATYSDAVSPAETEDDRESRYLKTIYDDLIDKAKRMDVLPDS